MATATATAARPPAPAAAARRRDRWLTPAACLAATLPVIVSTIRGIVDGYTACGDYRLLPLAILLASFAAQAELTFVLPAAAALVVGVVGLLVYRRQCVWPWAAAALAVAVVCWAPPLVDELTHRTGNLSLIAQ